MVQTLEELSNTNDTKAGAFKTAVTQFSFIITITAVEHVLAACVQLSKLLQSTTCDLLQASVEAQVVIAQISGERNDVLVWQALFEQATQMARSVGVEPTAPRGGRHQQHRPNVPAGDSSEYWRINMFLPFVDHLLTELDERLLQGHNRYKIQYLLPVHVRDLDAAKIQEIHQVMRNDLECDEASFLRECDRWKVRCATSLPRPSTAIEEVLRDLPQELYPNVSKCLHVLLAMPVSTASAERSFSSMRRLKTYFRSTMSTGRLSGLGLMNIHRDIELRSEIIVDIFARRKQRRLALLFNGN